jgi:spermidine/putrescine transport system substrate-binding protein
VDATPNGSPAPPFNQPSRFRLSRREVLRYAGLGTAFVGASSFLAACAKQASVATAPSSTFDWTAWWNQQPKTSSFTFANWPYYIDTKHGQHPTLEAFTRQTNIQVNYRPAINDNAAFFATLQPELEAGKATGWDLMVVTNGSQLSQLIDNGWLIPLDHSLLPNFSKNASALVKNPNYDPGNKYTIAWQSGFTGVAYSPQAVTALGHVPDSLDDLWNPAVKGKVGMMSDNTELGSVGLLKIGVDPATSTPTDWTNAAKVLQQQKNMGLVRNYYDQSYIDALENGDTWITQAWSGDILQANESGYPTLKFMVPKEGIMFWTDNMMIPAHAANPLDAITYMNYVYEPHVAAALADYIGYVTPVPAAQSIIANALKDPTTAHSPLVFPDAAIQAKAHRYYVYKGVQDLNQWNNTFEPIIQS